MGNNIKTSSSGENFSIAALVLGIISNIVAFIPCINVVALVTSLLTIIFAVVGLYRAKNANSSALLAKISLVLGIVALVFSIILVLVYGFIIGALSFWD
ncbi:hypothetical protein NJT12_13110 [Flavobacterium sp. AC]|uniref:DUF4190 domain-containing protein n=1 Tax=Flavobacterium azizsancarii TaxID=2961580 RepID=A0ABT4WDA7_9FLAO|nr:hypothetical protein [Flavobacterium azizsancarii]MDA6070560.1 hypothetical protein [Flavobacterium azizsancarii]